MPEDRSSRGRAFGGLGHRIAPPRFLLFTLVAVAGIATGTAALGWRLGVMAGFDAAALLFLLSCLPLLDDRPADMRANAERNDANRAMLLAITMGVTLVILVAIAAELGDKSSPQAAVTALIVATLVLAWTFSNAVFALHYAHLFYTAGEGGEDSGGLAVPKTAEPDYWDMLYFSVTLGMTFQTSDVEIESPAIRRVVTFHTMLAFVFNIGVLAFTINVLGGG
ncbi:DUF1345 domain-containing protein [Sphingomonas solaris]|uniref:DUF1345 domain-containing protein n=1 Tax=Alterirhizorhabdus solaris TaxID=2529389 RepID=A0A558QYQ3_9SPHN|nr:DUF1345 domain-containing protein [Sphingomonas solaris]TVV72294.1 DUF1345 domain-containing protein [Sphingomonas solaris]